MTQKALRFALEALDNLMYWDNGKSEYDEARDAIIAIKEALAQHDSVQAKPEPKQEPVAWVWVNNKGWLNYGETPHDMFKSSPLYPHPQRTWVGLTNDELTDLFYNTNLGQQSAVAQAIALLKERNT